MRPGLWVRSDSIAHGPSASTVSDQTSKTPQWMPCNIGGDVIAIMSAHDYFHSKLERAPPAGVKSSEGSSKFGKDSRFCKAVVDDYTYLAVCKSSRNAFSHLINDRFFNRAISMQGESKAVKVNTSATNLTHSEW